MTVQDYIISFCYRTPEVNMLAGVILCHSLIILNESLLAVGHRRVVLNVSLSNIPLDGFSGIVLVKHCVTEGHHVPFVLFKMSILVCHISLSLPVIGYLVIDSDKGFMILVRWC